MKKKKVKLPNVSYRYIVALDYQTCPNCKIVIISSTEKAMKVLKKWRKQKV